MYYWLWRFCCALLLRLENDFFWSPSQFLHRVKHGKPALRFNRIQRVKSAFIYGWLKGYYGTIVQFTPMQRPCVNPAFILNQNFRFSLLKFHGINRETFVFITKVKRAKTKDVFSQIITVLIQEIKRYVISISLYNKGLILLYHMLQKCDSFSTLYIWYECITAEWRKTLPQASLLTSLFDKVAQRCRN